MSDDSVPWPKEDVGPKDHLHALGVISVYYNLFEDALGLLFSNVARDYETGEFLFRRLNNQERLATLKFYFPTAEKYNSIGESIGLPGPDRELLSHIEYLISYCSICIENRNILMHSRHNSPSDSVLSLQKTSKATGAASKLHYYQLSLEQLRGIGDELIRGLHYILDVNRYITAKAYNLEHPPLPPGSEPWTITSPYPQPSPFPPPTLPERPPRPNKLAPLP